MFTVEKFEVRPKKLHTICIYIYISTHFTSTSCSCSKFKFRSPRPQIHSIFGAVILVNAVQVIEQKLNKEDNHVNFKPELKTKYINF